MSACGLIAGIGSVGVADGGADVTPEAAPPSGDVNVPDVVSEEAATAYPRMPAGGLYSYAISGNDHLQGGVINSSNTYGPFATISIEPGDGGCYAQTIRFRDRYDERMDMCIQGFDVDQLTGRRTQSFPLVGSVTTVQRCSPGDLYFTTRADLDASWPHDCRGDNEVDSGASAYESRGTYYFLGEETIAVMGRQIRVLHFRDERVVSDKQNGTHFADWYLESDTGLVVRMKRTIDVNFPSFNNINYKESLDMKLLELEPRDSG